MAEPAMARREGNRSVRMISVPMELWDWKKMVTRPMTSERAK